MRKSRFSIAPVHSPKPAERTPVSKRSSPMAKRAGSTTKSEISTVMQDEEIKNTKLADVRARYEEAVREHENLVKELAKAIYERM